MKCSWPGTCIKMFWPYLPRCRSRARQNRSPGGGGGVPFFKKLLLQTWRLQQQTEFIAVILYLQTTASSDMSSKCRFAWNETRMTWRHDVYKAGNETCFRINCLLAEVTHVILWSNRYDRVDKYLLYWIPGCRYTVQWFNCRPGLLMARYLAVSWIFRFLMNQISLTLTHKPPI